jgi:hypothetical protein
MYTMMLDSLLITTDSEVNGKRVAETSAQVILFAYKDDVTVTGNGCEPLYGLTELQQPQF